jgi:hypothetical protein
MCVCCALCLTVRVPLPPPAAQDTVDSIVIGPYLAPEVAAAIAAARASGVPVDLDGMAQMAFALGVLLTRLARGDLDAPAAAPAAAPARLPTVYPGEVADIVAGLCNPAPGARGDLTASIGALRRALARVLDEAGDVPVHVDAGATRVAAFVTDWRGHRFALHASAPVTAASVMEALGSRLDRTCVIARAHAVVLFVRV